jgi:hypothetical protein
MQIHKRTIGIVAGLALTAILILLHNLAASA